ncbi:MAG: hypothetical protein H3Z50_01705 [archaeon]|nr:hypothetical protein [archaeon]MCP8305577.1 hypothetical protein [archaeon]
MFESLISPNINCPKCGGELITVHMWLEGSSSEKRLALTPTEYVFCQKCEKFYKLTVQAVG